MSMYQDMTLHVDFEEFASFHKLFKKEIFYPFIFLFCQDFLYF